MLACEDVSTISVYSLDIQHIMERVLYWTGTWDQYPEMMQFNDKETVILYKNTHPLTEDQSELFTFIDSISLLKQNGLEEPIVVRFEKDYFYEEHADKYGLVSILRSIGLWNVQ